MNYKIYIVGVLLSGVIASCNNSNKSDPEFSYDKVTNTKDSTKTDSQITVPQNNIQTITPPPATSKPIQNTTTGLNPEHGQPGHRCEIAVGAPLNSKPTTTTPVQQNPPQAITTKSTTAAGMNPPHGEPGHRCDISVGAPLNQPAKSNQPQSIKTVSPLLKDSIKK